MNTTEQPKERFIIFLDFDGVLCTMRQAVAEGDFGLLGNLDPVAIRFLDRMCQQYNIWVIISSTWRIGETFIFFNSLFKAAGAFNISKSLYFKDFCTPSLSGIRGLEIEDWLKRNDDVTLDYLILDDETDMLDYQMSRLVKTDSLNGMMLDQYIKIKDTLKEQFTKT